MEHAIELLQSFLPSVWETLWRIFIAIILFFVGRKFISLCNKWVDVAMKRASFDKAAQKFLSSLVTISLLAVLIFILADIIGIPTASMLALIGSAGLAIGLALQGSLSNFAGGVLLLLLKPFTAGDYITDVNSGVDGTVESVELFYTRIITPDNRMIFIPNGTLANTTIINFSAQQKRRFDMTLQLEFDCDIKEVKRIIWETVNSFDCIVDRDQTIVYIDSIGESAIVVGLRCWIPTSNFLMEKWAITEAVKLALDENNIPIAYRKLDVQIKNQ